MSSQTLKRSAQTSWGKKSVAQQHCGKTAPFPAALIPLPRIDAAPSTFDYAESEISSHKLAQIGLWMAQEIKPQGIARPGPWDRTTEHNRIKADLIVWIEAMLVRLGSKALKEHGFVIELESIGSACGDAAAFICLYFPREVHVLSCNVLPAIAEENPGLEAVVRVAFQSLYWFKYGYNYDDCFEQFQDWQGEQLYDLDLSEAERAEIAQDIEQAKNEIPPAYRFLFRGEKQPEFPPFPGCPPEDSWLNAWWHWAKRAAESIRLWEKPIPNSMETDLYDREQVDHGYLTPFLWPVPGRLMDFFWELLDSEAQTGGDVVMAFPIDSAAEAATSIAGIGMFSQWIDLFIEACLLSDKNIN